MNGSFSPTDNSKKYQRSKVRSATKTDTMTLKLQPLAQEIKHVR